MLRARTRSRASRPTTGRAGRSCPVEPERLAHLLDLVDEAGDRPTARVVGLVAVGGAELVVVVVLDAGAGEEQSHASKYSWVAPGPPCSRSTLTRGLLPTRLVQTRNSPFGVVIGISRTPPDQASSRPVLSKYSPSDSAAGHRRQRISWSPSPTGVSSACRCRTSVPLTKTLTKAFSSPSSALQLGAVPGVRRDQAVDDLADGAPRRSRRAWRRRWRYGGRAGCGPWSCPSPPSQPFEG